MRVYSFWVDRDILWFPTALRCTTRTGPRRMKAPKEETLSLGMGNAANWVIWMETPQHLNLLYSWFLLVYSVEKLSGCAHFNRTVIN